MVGIEFKWNNILYDEKLYVIILLVLSQIFPSAAMGALVIFYNITYIYWSQINNHFHTCAYRKKKKNDNRNNEEATASLQNDPHTNAQ